MIQPEKSKFKYDIGGNIKSLRKGRKYTQKELAEKMGLAEKTINRWENNKRQPEADHIITMCKELDVSADKLLGNERRDVNDNTNNETDNT